MIASFKHNGIGSPLFSFAILNLREIFFQNKQIKYFTFEVGL